MIVEYMLADFHWELDFWAKETGLPAPSSATSITARFMQLPHGNPDTFHNAQVNPYASPSGFHPRIHLIAAAEALIAHPDPSLLNPLEELLEFWFAYAQTTFDLRRHPDIQVLETLVECYQSTAATANRRDTPEFLRGLIEHDISRKVTMVDNLLSHEEDGVTYIEPVWRDDGTYSLAALAKRAQTPGYANQS